MAYEIRFEGKDGCTYCYDETERHWVKICSVEALPADVKNALKEAKDKARKILAVEG